MNKKIKNATPCVVQDIQFKSKIEGNVYKWLKELGIDAEYEKTTYTLSPQCRPTCPYYTRHKKGFIIDMKPLSKVTYTPDFIFTLNGIQVILEVKGIVNDVYPLKKNLFRKELEKYDNVFYFEIRSKKELIEALRIIRAEDAQVQQVRKLITSLPDKDIPIAHKLLEGRKWAELHKITSLAIKRVEKANANEEPMHNNINLESLRELLRLT